MSPALNRATALEEALEGYLAFLQLEKGLSKNTLLSYQTDLKAFLEGFKHLRSFKELRMLDISNALADLASQKLAVSSSARKITALRTFLSYLYQQRQTSEDFSERIALPKQRRKLPQTLPLEQYEKLLAAIPTDTPEGLRDRAIVELLFGSGLRVSELTSLRITDLPDTFDFLRVMGKGSKERLVPMGTQSAKALKEYLKNARPTFALKQLNKKPSKAKLRARPTRKDTDSLFLTRMGTGILRKMVWFLLRRYAAAAGLPKNLLKPHLLRHSFATELLKGGADLRVIQEMLGHSSIATTQIYTAVETSHLEETHAVFHPRKKL